MKRIALIFLLTCLLFACRPILHVNETIELARSTENSVQVIVSMQRGENDQFTLLAVFQPLEPDMHLYSKDIPQTGVEGLGRPTRLELSEDSAFQALGEVQESAAARIPDSEPFELLVYPVGPVTLRLPVRLIDTRRSTETLLVTYMACDQRGCRAPVQDKAIEIIIPKQGAGNYE
jgi:hypothetical protein